MGLLEKALRYKKDINRMGKETLIDRIKGPAETAMLHDKTEEELREGKESVGKEQSGAGVLYEDGNYDRDGMDYENSGEIRESDKSTTEGDIRSAPRNPSPSGMNVSPDEEDDEIFTLSEEDLKEAFEEDHADSDDGIFQLPDMDDGSPLDTLESQKGVTLSEEVEVEDSSVRERVGRDDDSEESDRFVSKEREPLGPDDEPVLPVKGEMASVGEKGAGVAEGGSKVERGAVVNGKRRSEVLHPSKRRDVLKRSDRKFQDFFVLHEIGKDIYKAESERELFDVILFSVMGQIGAASSSIMVPSTDDESKWFIVESRGVTVDNPMLYFSTEDGIMNDFLKSREIVDIEQYKNIPEYRDEYYKFISVDGRLLSPLNYNGSMIGALILGDKITVGDYSEEEMDFINSVCEISAVALRRINGIEDLKRDSERYRTELDDISEIDSLSRRLIKSASLSGINEILNDAFKGMGISAYSIFMSSEKYNEFIPLFVEDEDFLTLRESNFSVKYNSAFIRYILDLSKEVRVSDFSRVREINEAFNEKLLRRMSHFWIYPFKIGADLIGFLAVFRVDMAESEDEVYKKLSRFSEILFPCILSVQRFDTQENRYIDSIEVILRRAEKQLDNARDLKIPLTIILFSIKNFKRYYSLYGYDEARRLVESIEGVIKGRLSTHDFSARVDRNKVLVILPGNNKKYAVPLANAIKNEILQGFKKKEMQLLITFLTAEYPVDGEDLYSLLDSID
jgi:GGDEF domain-containing protein